MAERFHRHHLGVVVDIVPNHMARPTPESRNKQLWSVLYQGRASPYAHWFDVDWDAQDGKLLMPILAGPLEKCLDDLIIDTAPKTPEHAEHRGPVLRYFDHVLPLRDGVADLPLGMLLAQQHYRLADWHDAATQLNWRRFFDIDTLIAVRAEDPDVFEATHRVPLRLAAEGLIDGLRVDHPDGLADPGGYLRRLAVSRPAACGSWWRRSWPAARSCRAWDCAGTTGYDALALVDGLFVDPDGGRAAHRGLRRLHRREAGLRRGGPGRQAGHRRRHVHRRAVPADPAVRPGRLSRPWPASARATCTTCWSSCWPRSASTGPT